MFDDISDVSLTEACCRLYWQFMTIVNTRTDREERISAIDELAALARDGGSKASAAAERALEHLGDNHPENGISSAARWNHMRLKAERMQGIQD